MNSDPTPSRPGAADACAAPQPPAAVLDTNVALDWLLFADPAVAPLASAIETGRIGWLACAYMRDEFRRVLHYPALERWIRTPDHAAEALARFDRHARLLSDPVADRTSGPTPTGSSTAPLVCSDPDDQVFLDLSRAHDARWLVTRDRALLGLARRAAPLGLAIVTPAAWAELSAAPPSP